MRRELSVVVVSWNTREQLNVCLGSVERHLSGVDHQVIVVDNASGDGSAELVSQAFPEVELIRNATNLGFGRACNQAMRQADGEWLLLLNSDAALIDDSVAKLFARVRGGSEIGIAQCRLVFPDGRLQPSAYRFPRLSLAFLEDLGLYRLLPRGIAGRILLGGYWDHAQERDVEWVTGAFMLLPAEVFAQTGGFDESLFMYGEDLEWCYRIRDRGWRIRYYPDATVVHGHHVSSDQLLGDKRVALSLRRQRDIYRQRHGSIPAAMLMLLRLAGAGLRTAFFAMRGLTAGSEADLYAEKRAASARAARTFARLAFSRR